ncbi:MAG: hypothetical protein ACKOAU_07120 [Pirellula sp.]
MLDPNDEHVDRRYWKIKRCITNDEVGDDSNLRTKSLGSGLSKSMGVELFSDIQVESNP